MEVLQPVRQMDIEYTPVFMANKLAYDQRAFRVIGNEGSSRSSKSYSIAQLLCWIALNEKKQITVCSPSLPHLKRGAMKDVLDVLKTWNIYNDNDFNKTDFVYKFPKTGSYIEFFGVEQTDKLRGPGRDILWCNEVNLMSYESYVQLALRTKDVIFTDMNPADEFSWIYEVHDKEGNIKIHSTYKNNLRFITKAQREEIEGLQNADENLWKVYGLGLRGTSTETIYTHWKQCDSFPQCDMLWYGLDFGFNHPNVLLKIGVLDDKVYVDEQIYETKLTTDELCYLIKALGITRYTEIFCDSARPDTIEELKRTGLNALPSDKSVWDGIQFVKSKQLYITRNSINLIKELKSYKWQVDKNGKVQDMPVKFRDDACFVEDTNILTDRGNKKISSIKKGDNVLTSAGYRKVLNVFNNGCHSIRKYKIKTTKFVTEIICTPNHLIKVANTWIPISQLHPGQKVSLPKYLMGKNLSGIMVKDITPVEQNLYIVTFGNVLTGLLKKGTIFTTWITMLITTISQILNVKKGRIIYHNMERKGSKIILNGLNYFRRLVLNQQSNGTSLQMVQIGINNMQRDTHSVSQILQEKNAIHAHVSISQNRIIKNSALIYASQNIVESQEQTMWIKYANIVKEYLIQISTMVQNTVQQDVVLSVHGSCEGVKEVFDLEVEDKHEYFANGILVHNCDAMRYGIYTKLSNPIITDVDGNY